MSGSTEGGLSLTIYGNYFDDREPYVAPRAYVGGENFFLYWGSIMLVLAWVNIPFNNGD